MHIISPLPTSTGSVEITSSFEVIWHLPEVEWHEVTVTLIERCSPHGEPITSWQIDATYDGSAFAPTWSSGRDRRDRGGDRDDLRRQARIRVPRHDGPCVLAVRVEDTTGEQFTSLISQNRR
jgi:hypothetical protein